MKLLWSLIFFCSGILAMEEYAKISLLEAIMGDKFIIHQTFYEFRDFVNPKNSRHLVYQSKVHDFFQHILHSSNLKNKPDEYDQFILSNKDQILNKTLSSEKKSKLLQLKISEILEVDADKGNGEFKRLIIAMCNHDSEQFQLSREIFVRRREISQLLSCCIS